MSMILASVLQDLLEMDHVDTSTSAGKTTYTFKTTSLVPSLVELKSKILSIFDFPIDVPDDVNIREVKKGKLFKEYLVDITVDSAKIGKAKNLLSKKYGIVRNRPYTPS